MDQTKINNVSQNAEHSASTTQHMHLNSIRIHSRLQS